MITAVYTVTIRFSHEINEKHTGKKEFNDMFHKAVKGSDRSYIDYMPYPTLTAEFTSMSDAINCEDAFRNLINYFENK